jgi:hypothetical protein
MIRPDAARSARVCDQLRPAEAVQASSHLRDAMADAAA